MTWNPKITEYAKKKAEREDYKEQRKWDAYHKEEARDEKLARKRIAREAKEEAKEARAELRRLKDLQSIERLKNFDRIKQKKPLSKSYGSPKKLTTLIDRKKTTTKKGKRTKLRPKTQAEKTFNRRYEKGRPTDMLTGGSDNAHGLFNNQPKRKKPKNFLGI